MLRLLGCLTVWIAAAAGALAAEAGAGMALGATTCGFSSCHDAETPWPNSAVTQREYAVWRDQDPHSGAYRTLQGDRARRIARGVGLGDATTARACLACHALNLPAERREETFDITEGVTCESCHAPASGWLGVHSAGLRFYGDNLDNGMYPTTDPSARAALCLSCHVGKGSQIVTHQMIASGHPAPPFELGFYSWFARSDPRNRSGYAHFTVDDDYLQRKPWPFGVRVWAIGQVAQAAAVLDLIVHPANGPKGFFPELALFDCRSCHRASVADGGAGAALPRFKAANMLFVGIAADLVSPGLAGRLRGDVAALQASSTVSWDAVIGASRRLRATLGAIETALKAHRFTEADTRAALRRIAEAANAGRLDGYEAAEQAVLSAGSLSDELTRLDKLSAADARAATEAVAQGLAAFRNIDSYSDRDVRAALNRLSQIAAR